MDLPANQIGVRRALWIINHRTLMEAEVPILCQQGFAVYVPNRVPADASAFRSAVVERRFDADLDLPEAVMALLDSHDFYADPWNAELAETLNDWFDMIVVTLSGYTAPLFEALFKFDGHIVARAFGREHPETYAKLLYWLHPDYDALVARIRAVGERFIFAQGFDVIAEIEEPFLADRAVTIGVPLPSSFAANADSWRGDAGQILFLCPTLDSIYYGALYAKVKAWFSDLPHDIFGRQNGPVYDPHVLPYVSDEKLADLYAGAALFAYPSDEPRHVHYSPIEAIVIGTPVLYLAGTLLDTLAGEPLAGRCADLAEMREKAVRLVGGDVALAAEIRKDQPRIARTFTVDHARRQWSALLRSRLRRPGEG